LDNTKLIPEGVPGGGLDDFTIAYIECMLWSSNDESDENTGGEPLDKNYDIDDIAPEAMAKIVADCERFQRECAALLAEAEYEGSRSRQWSKEELAGHDFWLTRCGHGVGFWDRGLGEVGDKLTEAAKKFGEVWPIVGDDGKIYV
jgi:hypothetical protein